MKQLQAEQPQWPYKHRVNAVAVNKGENEYIVKVYSRYIPGLWFFMLAIILVLAIVLVGAIGFLHWADNVSKPVHP